MQSAKLYLPYRLHSNGFDVELFHDFQTLLKDFIEYKVVVEYTGIYGMYVDFDYQVQCSLSLSILRFITLTS